MLTLSNVGTSTDPFRTLTPIILLLPEEPTNVTISINKKYDYFVKPPNLKEFQKPSNILVVC